LHAHGATISPGVLYAHAHGAMILFKDTGCARCHHIARGDVEPTKRGFVKPEPPATRAHTVYSTPCASSTPDDTVTTRIYRQIPLSLTALTAN
jgi:hypothetical protein